MRMVISQTGTWTRQRSVTHSLPLSSIWMTDQGGLSVLREWPTPSWHICLGASWLWLCRTWRKLLIDAHRSHPFSPPVLKTWSYKPNTCTILDGKKACYATPLNLVSQPVLEPWWENTFLLQFSRRKICFLFLHHHFHFS